MCNGVLGIPGRSVHHLTDKPNEITSINQLFQSKFYLIFRDCHTLLFEAVDRFWKLNVEVCGVYLQSKKQNKVEW